MTPSSWTLQCHQDPSSLAFCVSKPKFHASSLSLHVPLKRIILQFHHGFANFEWPRFYSRVRQERPRCLISALFLVSFSVSLGPKSTSIPCFPWSNVFPRRLLINVSILCPQFDLCFSFISVSDISVLASLLFSASKQTFSTITTFPTA